MKYTTTLINIHSHGFQVIDEYLPNIPNHPNITYKANPKVAYNVRHSTLLEWQERLSMLLLLSKFQKVVEVIHSSYVFQYVQALWSHTITSLHGIATTN